MPTVEEILGVVPSLAAPRAPGNFQRNTTLGRQLFRPGGNGGVPNTFRILMAMEAGFSQVALVFANYTNAAQTVDKAAVAVTAAPGNGYTPSGGDASSWVPVTFAGGSASGTIPASSASGAAATHGLLVSDWIAIASLPRNDGGTLPLLLTAAYTSTGTLSLSQPSAGEVAAYNAANNGRIFSGYVKSGDAITVPANFTSPSGPTTFLAPVGVLVRSDVRGLSVLACGDSTFQGSGSTTGYTSWLKRACEAVSSGVKPVSWINGGFSGMTTALIQTNAKAKIASYKPNVAFIQTWSINDSPSSSQANADAAFARALDVADYAVQNHCTPILVTPVPASSVSVDTARRSAADRVRRSGFRYLDLDAILRDGATPSRLQAQFDSGDGIHPNDAGYAAAAGAAAALLAAL